MTESGVSAGADLVPIHGGSDELVDCRVTLAERSRFVAEADGLPPVRVTRADLSILCRISDGGLSPLDGPMRGDQWHRVLDERRIEEDGRHYAWTIPLSLPVASEEAAALSRGGSAALRDESGVVVGILDDIEIFDWVKDRYLKVVYWTDRLDHPGGQASLWPTGGRFQRSRSLSDPSFEGGRGPVWCRGWP